MDRITLSLLLVLAITTSGCAGLISEEKTYAFEASPATVQDDVHDELGYMNETISNITVNESFSVLDITRNVEITNRRVRYEKQVNEITGAQFTTLSIPNFTIAGRSFNLLENASEEQIIRQAVEKPDRFGNITRINTTEGQVLGKNTTVKTFAVDQANKSTNDGFGEYSGELRLHITKVTHNDDVVVAMGTYPSIIDEKSAVIRMMENLEHNGTTTE